MKQNQGKWNPETYLIYNSERLRPITDLLSFLQGRQFSRILDGGCGPGNSTAALRQMWPDSHITAIDSSEEMIKEAKRNSFQAHWAISDFSEDHPEYTNSFDLVFSNSVIHWIPDHKNQLKRMIYWLKSDGVLAVQIPLFFDMPLAQAIEDLCTDYLSDAVVQEVHELFTIHDSSFYYDVLSSFRFEVNIWESSYIHPMDSHRHIVDMIASTGLKPYLARLNPENDKEALKEQLAIKLESVYPVQANGKILLPFPRLFFIAS